MRNQKTPFQLTVHCTADNVARSQNLRTRLRLYKALILTDELKSPEFITTEGAAKKELAQQLSFIPELKSGWGPSNTEIEETAKKLIGGYFAHLEVFAAEGFPRPGVAALEMLKDFDFEI